MNVICYKRVSANEQANRGFSLQHQEKMLKQYCEYKNYNKVDVYTEDYSAKTFDRPEWNKIMACVRKNKKAVDLILCLRWDRFSRNQFEAYTVIKELNKYGVSVNTIEQPLDMKNPDNKVLLSLYLTMPEVENDKISKRAKEGMHRAQLDGCWTLYKPKGYDNFRDGKNSTLRPNKDAPLVREAFERMATGSYSAEEVRKWINSKGILLTKQVFLNMIRNYVYIRKIFVKAYGNDPDQIVQGLHSAIISEETFYQANDVLSGRKRNMKFHDDKSDIYPLKGFLTCPTHGTSITAYGARGRLGELHYYKLCVKSKDCGQHHKIEDVNDRIERILSQISVSAQTLNLYI